MTVVQLVILKSALCCGNTATIVLKVTQWCFICYHLEGKVHMPRDNQGALSYLKAGVACCCYVVKLSCYSMQRQGRSGLPNF